MTRILVKGTQITVPNTVGAATSFSEATVVRLANPSANDRVVTVAENNGGSATIGTFTILADTTELLEKNPSDVVFVNAGTDVQPLNNMATTIINNNNYYSTGGGGDTDVQSPTSSDYGLEAIAFGFSQANK